MKLFLKILGFLALVHLCTSQTKQSCFSPIYGQGDLLHVVQTSGIFNDSKTFVDMAMINSVNQTLKQFETMMAENEDKPSKELILEFVHKNFKSIGELEEHYPEDFKEEPKIIKELSDPVVRKFAKRIISIWPSLCRKVSHHVHSHPDTHSLIPVERPFIIPGGRFKEFYYWDTYWIIKGLLLSDMIETAKGMVENLLSMVERFGFIPNGGRIYYLNRSQPPLITLMMADYIKFSKDFEFLKANVKTLETELHFWLDHRLVEIEKGGVTYRLARYDSESDTPRPESYLEDLDVCVQLSGDAKYECFTDLKSGAESGWDFTSRWIFDKKGELSGDLRHITTRRNVPVDLNSFLYKAFKTLHKFHLILENQESARFWGDKADEWKNAIENVMYNEDDGIWYDYDLKLKQHRRYFFASNLTPLWAGAMEEDVRQQRGARAVEYLKKQGIHKLRGGIPSSLFSSGLQWDFPNAWSPYQNLVIIGLHKSGDESAIEFARDLAHIWVNSNIRAFHDNKVMFEKYNAQNAGQFGGGGEYQIQSGFGWSNGCILELIDRYYRTKTRKYLGGF